MPRLLGILTGGGDCPGLNPAIRAVVLRAARLGYECLGIKDGWKGMIEGASVPLGLAEVENIVGAGGTILGTSRTNPYKKEGGVESVLANFRQLNLAAVVAMGGEDTLGVAARLHAEKKFPVVGVPKTMDNDLSSTDYTFGFDSAASVAMDAAERLKDTGRSHHRVMVLEVMGRHAGWVALYAGLAAGADAVLIPEKPYDKAALISAVKAAHDRKSYALVVTSEAIDMGHDESEKLDEFGHMILRERGVGEKIARIIEAATGLETRAAVIGHIQRGGPPTLFDRILASRAGAAAVDFVHHQKFGLMASLRGEKIVGVPLKEASGALKTIPPDLAGLLDTFCPAGAEAASAHV